MTRRTTAIGGTAAAAAAAVLLVVTPKDNPVPSYSLTWDYPPASNVVFEVWRSEDLRQWVEYAETTNQHLPMWTTGSCGFFKVRARDELGLESDWARTK